MKNISILLIGMILLIGITSASLENLGTFKENTCIELKQICSDCTYNNISKITYPDSTNSNITNALMTKDDTYYNYTFCDTSQIGKYFVYGFGDPVTTKTIWSYYFTISQSGVAVTGDQGLIYLVFFLGALFLFAVCLIGAIKFPWKNGWGNDGRTISINHFKYLKILFICLTYVVFLFIIGLLRGVTYNLIPELGVYRLFNWAYWILLYCMYPLIIIFAVIGVVHYLEDRKLAEALSRGVPLR